VFEKSEWKVVAVPFFKFFNVDDDRTRCDFDWYHKQWLKVEFD
jgi:hypothetical protein